MHIHMQNHTHVHVHRYMHIPPETSLPKIRYLFLIKVTLRKGHLSLKDLPWNFVCYSLVTEVRILNLARQW